MKLKGSLKELKGCSFRYKIKRTITNLRYAWQRAWKGFDDTDVFNFSWSFEEKIIEILYEYKKIRSAGWWVPKEYQKSIKNIEYLKEADSYIFTDEQVDAILDTMIFHFQMSDEDYVMKKLYGYNFYDDEIVSEKIDYDYKKIAKVRKQNQDAGMKLLTLFLDDLWD